MHLRDGLLIPEDDEPYAVFYAPTRERSGRSRSIDHLVLHFTACKARERKGSSELTALVEAARFPGETGQDFARALAERIGEGPIPSILSLALQGEGDPRQSSWDFGVGDGPRDYLGGKVPIVQTNCAMAEFYTWHAGLSYATYSHLRSRVPVQNDEGEAVWDGRRFVPPFAGMNSRSVGIEVEYYGYLEVEGSDTEPRYQWSDRDVTDRLPGGVRTLESGRVCEALHPLTRQALYDLSSALVDEFEIPVGNIRGHREIDPLRRSDPVPAYSAREVRDHIRSVDR